MSSWQKTSVDGLGENESLKWYYSTGVNNYALHIWWDNFLLKEVVKIEVMHANRASRWGGWIRSVEFQEEGRRQGSAKTSAHLVGRLLSCLPIAIWFFLGWIEHILGSNPTPRRPKPRPISRNFRRREIGREVRKHLLPCFLLVLLPFLVDLLFLVSLVYLALIVILLLLYIKKRNWI